MHACPLVLRTYDWRRRRETISCAGAGHRQYRTTPAVNREVRDTLYADLLGYLSLTGLQALVTYAPYNVPRRKLPSALPTIDNYSSQDTHSGWRTI